MVRFKGLGLLLATSALRINAMTNSTLTTGPSVANLDEQSSDTIYVTKSTLVTYVSSGLKLDQKLPPTRIKAQESCTAMSVVGGISCSTSAGVEKKSTLVSGEDYQCSTEWKATSTCVGSGGQMSFAYDPSFSGPQTTYTTTHTQNGVTTEGVVTTQIQMSADVPPQATPGVDSDLTVGLIMTPELESRVLAIVDQICLQNGLAHNQDRKRQDPAMAVCNTGELPMPVQMQVANDIGLLWPGQVMLPMEFLNYWVGQGMTHQQVMRVLYILFGLAVIEQLHDHGGVLNNIGLGWDEINHNMRKLMGKDPGDPGDFGAVVTTNECACTASPDGCGLDPDADQGQDGNLLDIAPIPTAPPATTQSWFCKHGADPQQTQEYCACPSGSTTQLYVTDPYVYPYDYGDGTTEDVTQLCPYTALPDDALLYQAPTVPPVSSASIYTADPSHRICIHSSTTAGYNAGYNHWCACPDNINYSTKKSVFGIATTSGSTRWTTVYCPYTKYPPKQAMTDTAKPPAPAPTAFNYPVKPVCSVQAPIHWEKTAMSNAISKFCNQMSRSSVTYSPGMDTKTKGAWDGQPTSRSYPVGFKNKNKKDSVPEYMGIKISIAHDERYCNSTQSENGAHCEYSFKDEKRCSNWLLSTVNKCTPEKPQQDQSREPWAGGSVNGDGLTWNVTDGKECRPSWDPKGCWVKPWY